MHNQSVALSQLCHHPNPKLRSAKTLDVCKALSYLNQNSDVYLGYTGWAAGSFDRNYVLILTPNGNPATGFTDQPLLSKCFAMFKPGGFPNPPASSQSFSAALDTTPASTLPARNSQSQPASTPSAISSKNHPFIPETALPVGPSSAEDHIPEYQPTPALVGENDILATPLINKPSNAGASFTAGGQPPRNSYPVHTYVPTTFSTAVKPSPTTSNMAQENPQEDDAMTTGVKLNSEETLFSLVNRVAWPLRKYNQ